MFMGSATPGPNLSPVPGGPVERITPIVPEALLSILDRKRKKKRL